MTVGELKERLKEVPNDYQIAHWDYKCEEWTDTRPVIHKKDRVVEFTIDF